MDAPADSRGPGPSSAPEGRAGSVRDLAVELFFAGVGAVALTKDRVDELVEELSQRGQLTREEARDAVEDVTGRWRGDAVRMGERASSGLAGVMRELGLVTRREWEELELRISQIEHRVRLLESRPGPTAGPAPPPGGRGRGPYHS